MTPRHPKQPDRATTTVQPPVAKPQPAQLQVPLQPGALVQRAARSPATLSPAEVLQLHRAVGNRAVGQLVRGHLSRHTSGPAASPGGMTVQPKLMLGPVGDPYEQEADRVAQQVVQSLDTVVQPRDGQAAQRQEDDEDLSQIQPASRQPQSEEGNMTVPPDLEAAVQQLRGGGQPLPETLRGRMEQAFGADFSGVRVHADAQAGVLTRTLAAKAFTTGQDVFFREGAYSPASQSGQAVLAHELSHVVQQGGAVISPAGPLASHATAAGGIVQRMIGEDGHGKRVRHKQSGTRYWAFLEERATEKSDTVPVTRYRLVADGNSAGSVVDADNDEYELVTDTAPVSSSPSSPVTTTAATPTAYTPVTTAATTTATTPAPSSTAPTSTAPSSTAISSTATSSIPTTTGQLGWAPSTLSGAVQGGMTPKNPNWPQASGIKAIRKGRSNKGIFEISNDAGDTLVIKFTDEPISTANRFGDRVMAVVGIPNPDSVFVPSSDPQFLQIVKVIYTLIDAHRRQGKDETAQAAENEIKWGVQAKGLILMQRVAGVDFAEQLLAHSSSPSVSEQAKKMVQEHGADPAFNVVEFVLKPAFIQNLGKVVLADAFIGNQDRLSLEVGSAKKKKVLMPTFNPSNFKVLADGIIGAFDHDTLLYSRQFYTQKTGDVDPEAWVNMLLQGEDRQHMISPFKRASPALGAIFTSAGQQVLYDKIRNRLELDLSSEEKKHLSTAFTLEYFTQHFNLGLQAGLATLVQNADQLHQEAANLGASDLLDPEALEVKLSFLETKASEFGKPQGGMSSAAPDIEHAAERNARLVAIILHLLSGVPFHVDPTLLPVPIVPAKLAKTEVAKRAITGAFTRKERSEKSDEAQKLRKEAQSGTQNDAFFANLGPNVTKFQGSDKRRWQKAYFHLKLHQTVLAMTAHAKMLTRIGELLQMAVAHWGYLPSRQQTRLQNSKDIIKTYAEAARNTYVQVYSMYASQLPLKEGENSKDKYQALRILNAFSSVDKALYNIIITTEVLGTSTGKSSSKS